VGLINKIVPKRMVPKTPELSEPARLPPLGVVEPRNQFGRTWDEERRELELLLEGCSDKEKAAEIDEQHKLFVHFSKPIPEAQRRQAHLVNVYQATRPSLRAQLLDSILRNWI